ncbi:hypothetical protein PVK06_019992 [Gossypium arboreum]|uniref:Uncharacterized protein n=1 Tax=Gossypium arboreum TaxID=29729 RepID=A0ABR0PL91_GOSAR|nr:hypothetical protein PVK06_019992 [Gossypium arboreum]
MAEKVFASLKGMGRTKATGSDGFLANFFPEFLAHYCQDVSIYFLEILNEGFNKGVQILKEILKEYEEVSGQCMNYEKSIVFYSLNTSEQVRELILQTLNV